MTGVAERHDRGVIAALSLALLARAVLGFADSVAITRGTVLDLRVADVVAVAACVGYLITGIADIGALRPGAPLGDPGFWLFFGANLIVPGVVFGVLVGLRSWFMPVRAALPGRSRLPARLPRRGGGSGR